MKLTTEEIQYYRLNISDNINQKSWDNQNERPELKIIWDNEI